MMIDITILEKIIDAELFEKIKDCYLSGDYIMLITKSVDYFRDLLREKSEEYNLDSDKLVSECFSFKNNQEPKLTIGDINTETGSSQQRGIENFAYGIYRYIRNPQFHGHYLKFEEVLEALIIISFVIKKIKSSKSKYNKLDFINSLKDPNFDLTEKYTNIILSEVPRDILLNCLIFSIDYVQNYQINYKRYKLVLSWYIKNDIDIKEFYKKISNILETINDNNVILMWLYILGENIIYITEKAKLRSEYVLIKTLSNMNQNNINTNEENFFVINILNDSFIYLDNDNHIKIEKIILEHLIVSYMPKHFYKIILNLIFINIFKFSGFELDLEKISMYGNNNDRNNKFSYIYRLKFLQLSQNFQNNFHSFIKYSLKELEVISLQYANYYKLNDEYVSELKYRVKFVIDYYNKIILEENGYYELPF
ncbi:TIGR02391 family protein [Brachyspira hyodysenteriae]|uniref:TIGR02391 family protein n=1 Tax=Brachyspira hyodysenteriae TaxID=159 RepID=UPI000A14DF0C|nr:TIGR02391 family protein [Brachyspira hyodysenteriae]